jgi:hypothetical protein
MLFSVCPDIQVHVEEEIDNEISLESGGIRLRSVYVYVRT